MIDGINGIDELNKLAGEKRSLPFEQYFGEMGIDRERKKARINLAERIQPIFVYILTWCFYRQQQGMDIAPAIALLQTQYMEQVRRVMPITPYIQTHINNTATGIINTIVNNTDLPYVFSADRARYIAEDEANAIINYREYADAAGIINMDEFTPPDEDTGEPGGAGEIPGIPETAKAPYIMEPPKGKTKKKRKRWQSLMDGKERPTHHEANGQTVPINSPFVVGGYLMMYPKDESMGAGPEEIVHCRCWLEYL